MSAAIAGRGVNLYLNIGIQLPCNLFVIIVFMNKAFIFDMDGVIVNSENIWKKHESDFLQKLLGKQLSKKKL